MAGKIRRDDYRSRFFHRCLDVGLNWLALAMAYGIKERFDVGVPTEPVTLEIVLHTFTAVAIIWLGACSALGVYSFKRRPFPETIVLVTALAVTIAFFLSYVYFTRLFFFPRYAIIFYALFGMTLLTISRAIKYSAQRALHRRGYAVRRVVVVGAGKVARRLAEAFRENHSLGYHFLGFIAGPNESVPARDRLGRLDELETIIQHQGAQEIIIALPGEHHREIFNIAHRCQAADIRLRVVPDLLDVVMIRATITEIDDIPLIGLRDPVVTGYQSFVKRSFDLAVASFCLLLAAPLFLLIPLLIWLDSRGGVFFPQTRVGENGRPFKMYKFRSMVEDAEQRLQELVKIEELKEPMFKLRNDPRVTCFGKILRRTSMDELPQLLNVIKGDMSMVGPRPEELSVVEHYNLWHRKRLSIKPGITGPMQVSGRGELPLDDRIKLELLYISRYSILEDVKYLLRTIPAVCRARGAY